VFRPDRLPPNRTLNKIIAGSIGLQAAALLVPGIRNFLGVGTIGPMDALVALAGGTLPFVIGELRKAGRRRRYPCRAGSKGQTLPGSAALKTEFRPPRRLPVRWLRRGWGS
jgi:hypothetical protein